MPKTRSKTAQRSSNGDTDQQQSSEGTTTEASSATTTTTTATTTTEGNTDRTTTTDTSTEKQSETPQAHTDDEPVPVAPTDSADAPRPSEKRKSTCNSRKRTHRIAKSQRRAPARTEESRKLGGHSDGNPRHYRRTASEKRNDRAKQQNTDELATAAKIDTPPAVCATSTRPASETEQKKQTEIPTAVHATETSPTQHSRPEHIAPLQSTGNMITELATALTRRAGPAVRTTYQRFMAHIKNGSCSKHPTSTHARRSPNTKTC
ncbi:hypothetical protein EVAR_99683_1 [Eumeta japonica]|uniref:Uncharacterized protein n=1 Tax=Eumeta variegata TaxID=151549 RepID=A0A4C1YFM4_EUMVA|nr:hypothetical protein EVAR_99683_1 [Eumeta japonica]